MKDSTSLYALNPLKEMYVFIFSRKDIYSSRKGLPPSSINIVVNTRKLKIREQCKHVSDTESG
jgi:hypothetical protein